MLSNSGTSPLAANGKELNKKPLWERIPQWIYDVVFLLGWFSCLFVGRFTQLSLILSGVLFLSIAFNFFNEDFYLFSAIFVFMRYKMLLGDSPVYRLYSYLVVIRFLIELPKSKFRITYLPAIFVFALHSVFATGSVNMRLGLNVIVDVIIIYIVLMKVLADDNLTRKFFVAFILGGITSGIYGFTSPLAYKNINVAGSATEVNRNFGSLGDANFASMFYNMAIMTALFLKNLKWWIKIPVAGLFFFLLLKTASLSGLITLAVLGVFAIILKFRKKAIPIFLAVFFGGAILLAILLSIPQFRSIPTIAGILVRVVEKLRYIKLGRWDMLTTDRSDLWSAAMRLFNDKTIWGKLFGGSIITVDMIETKIIAVAFACHQSYIQALLNFGVIGTLLIYVPLLGVFIFRLFSHFSKPAGYGNEDIKSLQLIYAFAFIIFGFSVDFFIDWTYLLFYFI